MFTVLEFFTCLLIQAMRQEEWSDGQPTQVEEDLWDDSHLSVSTIHI